MTRSPLVSVITPVYNGGSFLRECIESVLAQTYQHWEYIIHNNSSTDDSLQIAEEYARQDRRVRVVSTDRLLPIMENFNRSLAQMSPDSAFYRTVHADDMIYPTCLEKSVAVAERYPSAGIIGSLRLRGSKVECAGLPTDRELFSGREISRWFLRREIFGFAPTTSMIRAELVRSREHFYPLNHLHADLEVFLDLFRTTDYAFVHEVLSYSREHETSITSTYAGRRQTLLLEWVDFLKDFGPAFFSPDELAALQDSHMRRYHRLIVRAFIARDRGFLSHHLGGLGSRDMRPSWFDLGRATVAEGLAALRRPARSLRHFRDSTHQP